MSYTDVVPCEVYLPEGKQRFWAQADYSEGEVRIAQTPDFDGACLLVGRHVNLKLRKRGWLFTEYEAVFVGSPARTKIVLFNGDADKLNRCLAGV